MITTTIANTTSHNRRGRLSVTLISAFVLLAVLPSVILVTLALNQADQQTRERTVSQMQSQSEVKANDINRWLNSGKTILALILTNEDQRNVMIQILQSDPGRARTATNGLIMFLKSQQNAQNTFSEFFIYDTQGLVRASTNSDFEIGNEYTITAQPYFDPSLRGTFIQSPYLDGNTLKMFITRPITNARGDIIGVLAGQLRLSELETIMTTRVGLGDTGETYLVTRDGGLLVTPSRFSGYRVGESYTSEGIQEALQGEQGNNTYENYRGQEVIGVYRWLPELQVGMLAEIETEETLGTLNNLRTLSIIAGVIVTIIAIIIGISVTLWIVRPIDALRQVALTVVGGDYTQRATIHRRNEIGELSEAFNTMTTQLVNRVEEINEKNKALEIATREAQQSSRIKSEFLATVSHELRTPMNAIIGFGDMLQMEVHGPLNEQQKDRLSRLQRNAKRLLTLINDILDLSRIETGRFDIVEHPFQPKQMINRLYAQMEVLSEKDNLYFHTRIAPELPDLLIGDEKRIEQVIVNLLSNAFKFTEKGGVVMNVSVDQTKNIWQIAVTDTGIGISPTAQQLIFEEFRQVDGSPTREYEGTGLGLAITQRMVVMMNGSINVSSQMGKGSTFTVTLPLVEPANPQEALIEVMQKKTNH